MRTASSRTASSLAMLLTALAHALIAAPAAGQSLRGVVVDADSLRPLGGTLVLVLDTAGARVSTAETDDRGRFLFRLPDPGSYKLATVRLDYGPASSELLPVAAGEVVEVEFRLSRAPVALAPIEVRVERRIASLERVGFYRRQAMGIGRFVMADAIERRATWRLTDALREEPSVRILDDTLIAFRGAHTMYFRNRHDACLPVVVLDGTRLSSPGTVNLVHPYNVEAVELYPSGNGAPPQFGGLGAPCGVVLIWTKRR